ncbi:hypothetical protein ASPCAL14350 [Aspergillus calidoustus]|uniref:CCHC-type domain-containing protein n=1 Tax=Aspergillus calidoustus TaxID=454130 RepID=A0A0U5GMQ5_ASPCI|nr:hypothetical protein ASPCAL14350 [Aspergillus calidoustus]
MQRKLKINHDRYPSQDEKIAYALTRLEGKAQEHALARSISDAKNPYLTVNDMYSHMKTVFADPNKKREARRKLKDLDLKSHVHLREHITDFSILVQDGQYDEDEYKELLNDSLSKRLRSAVMVYFNDDNVSYNQFVDYCYKVADNLSAQDAKQSRRDATNKGNNSGRASGNDNKNNQGSAGASSRTGSNTGSSTSGTSSPIPRVSEKERLRRRQDGLCYYCGEAGHVSMSCPNRKPKPAHVKICERPKENENEGKDSQEQAENGNA